MSGDFHLAHAFEGKEQLNQKLWGIFGCLLDDVSDCVGDSGMEQHTLHLHARQIHANRLTGLEHAAILLPREGNCKERRPGRGRRTARSGV